MIWFLITLLTIAIIASGYGIFVFFRANNPKSETLQERIDALNTLQNHIHQHQMILGQQNITIPHTAGLQNMASNQYTPGSLHTFSAVQQHIGALSFMKLVTPHDVITRMKIDVEFSNKITAFVLDNKFTDDLNKLTGEE